jgi:hypothetical protein
MAKLFGVNGSSAEMGLQTVNVLGVFPVARILKTYASTPG